LDEEVAQDKAMAEDFDLRLCEELRWWGMLSVVLNQSVAGWKAAPLKAILEDAQVMEAIIELPTDHPERETLIQRALGRSQHYLNSS